MKEKYIINKPEDFASLPTKIQEEILSYWNDAYYNKDNPEVSDELYDTCMAIYNKKTDKTIEYLGEVSVDFKQYEHKYPVLSLGKINKMLISFIGESTFYYFCEEFLSIYLLDYLLLSNETL